MNECELDVTQQYQLIVCPITRIHSGTRYHDLIVSCEMMSLGETRAQGKGLVIGFGVAETPFGVALFGWMPHGVSHLVVCGGDETVQIQCLQGSMAWPTLARDDQAAMALSVRIFSRVQEPEKVNLVVRGTHFQLKVWEAIHLFYTLGGLMAIGAMTLFMNHGRDAFGGRGIVSIALAYMLVGLKLAGIFQRKGLAIPAGICSTFVVVLVPLVVYGLQRVLGFWPESVSCSHYSGHFRWHWLSMELSTLVVGTVMVWWFRYPFLVMVLLAFLVDIRSRQSGDYAFWLYLFGVMIFWGGLTLLASDSELAWFLYCCVNLVLMAVGVILVRRVFVVFGAIGTGLYLGHLALSVFRDSWLFPVTLVALGLLTVYLGALWQRNERAMAARSRRMLPASLRELLESRSV